MLTFVAFVCFLVALLYWRIAKKGGLVLGEHEKVQVVSAGKGAARVALWVAILMVVIMSTKIVPADSRGLRFTLGAIDNVELSPGLHFRIPLVQSISNFTTRPMQKDYVVQVGPEGAITKDNQTVGAALRVFYIYNKGEYVKMYKDYGSEKLESLVVSSEVESFKATVGKYDIFVLPTIQDEIRTQTLEQLRTKMAAYPIFVSELKITNYDWSEQFDAQIQATMERAQQVKQKQQELLITEQEAQKQVKQAEAAKTSLILTAEGEKAAAELRAQAKAMEGEGIRQYNESVQKNMQLEIELRKLEIQKIQAEKWNGQYVPTNNYGPIPVQAGSLQPSQK